MCEHHCVSQLARAVLLLYIHYGSLLSRDYSLHAVNTICDKHWRNDFQPGSMNKGFVLSTRRMCFYGIV